MCYNPSATEPTSKECPKCGLKQAFKNKTCTECGFEFPMTEAKRRTKECPECGLEQAFTNRTCTGCGFAFPKATGIGKASGPGGPGGPGGPR